MVDEGISLIDIGIFAIGGTIFSLISTAVIGFLFWDSIIGVNGAYIGIFLVSIFYGLLFNNFIYAGLTGGLAGLFTGLLEPHLIGWMADAPQYIVEYCIGNHTFMLIVLAIIVSCVVSLIFSE